MKSVLAAGLFSGLAAAHSAAWSVTVDGAKFVPASLNRADLTMLDTRLATSAATTSLERSASSGSLTMPTISHGTPSPTSSPRALPVRKQPLDKQAAHPVGGDNPHPPELKAYARAGSNVTVQWSNIIHMHSGPVISVSFRHMEKALAYEMQVSRRVERPVAEALRG